MALTLFLVLAAAGGLSLAAQTTSTGAEQQVHADMNQLMRGVLYPAANVVFSAPSDNPAEIKLVPGHDPDMSTDPLTSTFGGWTAVENAALALAESANLLAIEGRRCSTGVVAPTKDSVWAGYVRDMRAAAMKGHAAATAKSGADDRGRRYVERDLHRLSPQVSRPESAGGPLHSRAGEVTDATARRARCAGEQLRHRVGRSARGSSPRANR